MKEAASKTDFLSASSHTITYKTIHANGAIYAGVFKDLLRWYMRTPNAFFIFNKALFQ
jgi:hypothetical protein